MSKLIIAFLVGLAATTPYAVAQKHEAQSPYAIEDCKAGCYVVKDPGSSGNEVYIGTVPRTFRICSADAYGGSLVVDGKTSEVRGTSFGVRSCLDVNGLNIVLIKGTVAVGALP